MTDRASASGGSGTTVRLGRLPLAAVVVLGLALFAVAYWRGGLLDLPSVPNTVTLEAAGLQNLGLMRERASVLETADPAVRGAALKGDRHIAKAAEGLAAVRRGEVEPGLEKIREALSEQPDDLVVGNAYRMSVLSLQRAALVNGANRETLAERLPSYLQGESIGTLERLYREHPSREAGFQLAMAWFDRTLLSAKPEDRVVAVVAAMKIFDEILSRDPRYLPALCARGIGYLNPPARIEIISEWHKTLRPVPNAASRDLSLCVAIGRRVGAASPQVAATQALNLGDAYAKEGQPQRARSWWQLAQNASRDPAVLEAVGRRYTWKDEELIDRLEAERDARALDVDHPLTDLSLIWRQ